MLKSLSACMYVHHMHMWYLRRSEEDVRFPVTGVTYACEPLCWCWDPNPDPLAEQVLLTAEPSLQSL